MKNEEIKTLSLEQLSARLKELKNELFNLRFSNATRNLANPLAIRNVRKEIARVQTAIRAIELANGGNNNGK
ncbi:MAG: 50S ribosomal protein L29 [Clostridia bacterium]|nr:50S ribosomal protein L29 [Clostridia bacterium]